jgi:hypothetical protein
MPAHDFVPSALSRTFTQFINSAKSGAIVLLACTVMTPDVRNENGPEDSHAYAN